eukprot:CAMPEP_0180518048 /NCGR_PEP_ID=MMETSP1036_2-20121128/54873_1 /TAXON_ID=632150 /ORGANISM="Azadinium spinosum, Strain 3D9" /LENGTH=191 /DNA_ID=CAMNT_0022530147 /DNA_START=19 /DNA_END=591 /DNA_ORIENTATION=-
MNNMDVLNEYFGQFGSVTAVHINPSRHEAIVTFTKSEDAEEALKWPVLNDPSIGLRPWRSKAGQRGPTDGPLLEVVTTVSGGAPASGGGAAASTPAAGSFEAEQKPRHMVLESGGLLVKKRQRDELQDRRLALLGTLTNQLKVVMTRISDPKITEKQREQLQTILNSLKDKITAMTPAQPPPPEPELPVAR